MIYCYARVSTTEQARADAVSIPQQIERTKAAAVAQGYSAIDVIEVIDGGVSGAMKLSSRPNGSAIYEHAKSGDVVVASKMDRLFRSALDAIETLEVFSSRGIDVILLDMGLEPVGKSAVSNLFFQMLAAFANFERLKIKERTKEGRRGKRARNGFNGGRSPYGFSVVGKGSNAVLTPHEQEQEIISIVKRMAADGHSPSRICRFLNFKDYSTREGKPWAEMQVIRIINQGQEKAA